MRSDTQETQDMLADSTWGDMVTRLAERLSEDRGYPREHAMMMASRYIDILDGIRNGSGAFFTGVDVTHGSQEVSSHLYRYWIDTNFLFTGRPSIVWAPTGVGKTHLASFVATRAMDLHSDWDILSNVPWYWIDDDSLSELRPDNLITISKMSEMLKFACESVIAGRRAAVIIDEMDNAVVSQNWRSPENKSWKSFSFIERHLEIHGPLIIYHAWNDIPFYMRRAGNVNDFLPPELHGGLRHVFSSRSRPHSLIVDEDIIPYSSHGEIGFTIDVDMERLRKRLRTSRRIEYAEQVLRWLPQCMIDPDEDEEDDENDREDGRGKNVNSWANLKPFKGNPQKLHRKITEKREGITKTQKTPLNLSERQYMSDSNIKQRVIK